MKKRIYISFLIVVIAILFFYKELYAYTYKNNLSLVSYTNYTEAQVVEELKEKYGYSNSNIRKQGGIEEEGLREGGMIFNTTLTASGYNSSSNKYKLQVGKRKNHRD